jgi:hypothetical protein
VGKNIADIKLDRRLYDQARGEKVTLTQLLERMDPSPEGSPLDAFERQLKRLGIKTKTIYRPNGDVIYADALDAFYRTEESAVLFPEFISRTVREAIVQDTMLPYLIGQNTVINGDSYRSYYVDDQPSKQKKKRVTEAAELPRVSIKGREQTVRIYKFGRAIESSYEALRRMQIDMLAIHVRRIAMEVAKDKVEEIIDVIKNGDGNNNAAPVLKMKADLDGDATAGSLSTKGFLLYLMEFEEFPCNTLVAAKDAFIQLVLANIPNLSTTDLLKLLAQGTTVGISLSAPQLPSGDVRLFWHKDVPTLQIYGVNRQYAIEQVTEAGSDISESDKFITRQTSVLTISENNGYSKVFNEATKILNINA